MNSEIINTYRVVENPSKDVTLTRLIHEHEDGSFSEFCYKNGVFNYEASYDVIDGADGRKYPCSANFEYGDGTFGYKTYSYSGHTSDSNDRSFQVEQSVIYKDGKVVESAVSNNHYKNDASVDNPLGIVTIQDKNVYDGEGRRIEKIDDYSDTITYYSYDDEGRHVSTTEVDKNGESRNTYMSDHIYVDGEKYSFDSEQLMTIVGTLDSTKDSMTNIFDSLAEKSRSIAGMAASEDSNVAGVLRNLASTSDLCKTQVSDLLTKLSSEIYNYVYKSTANQKNAKDELAKINAQIYDIGHDLNAINLDEFEFVEGND